MEETNNVSFYEKNKYGYAVLESVRNNLIKFSDSIYNPVIMTGIDKGLRYRVFLSFFDKEFNRKYKGTYIYGDCDKIDFDDIDDKKLVIVERIDLLNNNLKLQDKINKLLNKCLIENIQLILCSDVGIDDLDIGDNLKRNMLCGLVLCFYK